MRTIKNLYVKVTYTVGLEDVEVSNEVFEQLDKMSDYGFSVEDCESSKHPEAFDWLAYNIREDDAMDWAYEVEID
ncbi:hypothetical protein [Capnocytophaga sputigena]|uniref:hypothetical protein n=1 Tax=Capnocytophaga sputigena TaxID=1019 RepID=UPI000F71C008|nr:hypothetical protein [Capnocytophaga sputigena]VEI52646.1 Uncharacterised protein [Capnocytophaga sputigena]